MPPTEAVATLAERRLAFGRRLDLAGVDAAIIATEPSFAYLTGYATPSWAMRSRPIAFVAFRDGGGTAVLSAAEAPSVAASALGIAAEGYADPAPDGNGGPPDFGRALADRLVAVLGPRRPTRIAVELGSAFPPGLAPATLDVVRVGLGVELVDCGPLLWPLRLTKTDAEIGLMRAAADALAGVYASFAAEARTGMTERELHELLEYAAVRHVGAQLRYATVVAGAQRPLLGPPGARAWQPEDVLLVDVGIVRDGYWTDFSRHFAASEQPAAVRAAYARIVTALGAGRDACRPGARAGDVAAAMGGELPPAHDAFGRLGHGVGLELTEPPSLHAADRTELRPGMTLCLEPIAWFDGVGHLVGEEVVVVTESGCELLSPPFPVEMELIG